MTTGADPTPELRRDAVAAWQTLTPARVRARLSAAELYFRYVALGGTASLTSMSSHCDRGEGVGSAEHDRLVLALNERFLELQSSERLPYAHGGAAE